MTLHDRVLSALQANKQLSTMSKSQYIARLAALQRITGADSLEQVLLQPSCTLQALREQKCSSTGRPLANSSRKAYVASVLAALKHTPELLKKRAYRRARREFVRAFKELRSQVDQHTAQCASGEALPSRCDGYLPWDEICRVRDTLPVGSTERVLLELHTCCLGRSREYAAVKLFTAEPSKDERRAWPNYIVLHPHSRPHAQPLEARVVQNSPACWGIQGVSHP
jgi:hypothetical protein